MYGINLQKEAHNTKRMLVSKLMGGVVWTEREENQLLSMGKVRESNLGEK